MSRRPTSSFSRQGIQGTERDRRARGDRSSPSGLLMPSPLSFCWFGGGRGEAFEVCSHLWCLGIFIGDHHELQLRLDLTGESLVIHNPLTYGFCDCVQPLMGSWRRYRYRRRATSPTSRQCLICTPSPSSSYPMFTLQTCRGQDRYGLPANICLPSIHWAGRALRQHHFRHC